MTDDQLNAFLDLPEAQNGAPTSTHRWIVIPRWDGKDGFQHYTDRDPIWIKNYRSLLRSDEYRSLSFTQRGILHGLWLEYAASNRQIRDSTLTVTRLLGQRVTRASLDALNHAGFIQYSAIRPLAQPYKAASTEGETEREVEKKPPKTPFRRKSKKRKTVCPDCEVGGGQHAIDCPQVKPAAEPPELVTATKQDPWLDSLTSEGGHE